MKQKITQTDDYLLLTSSDGDRQPEDYFLVNKTVEQCLTSSEADDLSLGKPYQKITAYYPLNGAPVLDGVPLLPELPNEKELEKLAEEAIPIEDETSFYERKVWIDGYRAATKIYSEADLREAFTEGWNSCEDNEGDETYTQAFNRAMESLRKINCPKWFILEMINFCNDCGEEDCFNNECAADIEMPKTTTNEQGQTVLIGTYEF